MTRQDLLKTSLASAAVTLPGRAVAAPISRERIAPLAPPADGIVNVAVVIGPNANVIDLAGEWEVFQDVVVPTRGNADNASPFRMWTVSDNDGTLAATGGLLIKPHHTFATAPKWPQVVVMGAQGEHTAAKLAWIREAGKHADVVMSVCTGAFLLAKTGLLDDLRATTHHDFYDKFANEFPHVRLVRGPRFVDNGKIASAGGLTSGIELALHIVSRYFGDEIATRTARYMEYNRSSSRPPAEG